MSVAEICVIWKRDESFSRKRKIFPVQERLPPIAFSYLNWGNMQLNAHISVFGHGNRNIISRNFILTFYIQLHQLKSFAYENRSAQIRYCWSVILVNAMAFSNILHPRWKSLNLRNFYPLNSNIAGQNVPSVSEMNGNGFLYASKNFQLV